MWISDAVTPTSVACGFSLLDCAVAGPAPSAARLTSSTPITIAFRTLTTDAPHGSMSPDKSCTSGHPARARSDRDLSRRVQVTFPTLARLPTRERPCGSPSAPTTRATA